MNMDILTYIKPEMLIVVVALWVLGKIAKSTQYIPDWTIPYILLVAGIAGASGVLEAFCTDAIIQGILCAGVAVYGHQMIKQPTKELKHNIDKMLDE